VKLDLSGYAKGYRLERRIERVYSQYGWLVTRFPKSGRRSYPGDVFAVKRLKDRTVIHLIECKNLSKLAQDLKALYIQSDQIQRLLNKAREHDAQAFVAFSFPNKHARILRADKLKSSGKMFFIQPKDGIMIKEFLKNFN
jgi:Holliday junction resolvase